MISRYKTICIAVLVVLGVMLGAYGAYTTFFQRLSIEQAYAQYLETEVTIWNDVWDKATHSFRVTGGAGGILISDSPTVTGVWTFSPTTSLSASGTSTIIGSTQTITLTGVDPTTYGLIDAYNFKSPTIVGTNTGQTVTLGATYTIYGPVKGTNVAATALTALNIPTWNCSTATTCTGLIVNSPTGAGTNYGVDVFQSGTSAGLRLTGAINPQMRIEYTGIAFKNQITAGGGLMGTESSHAFSLLTANTARVTLTAAGIVQLTNHVESTGTAPGVSACGGSPSIVGTDTAGKVTIGSAPGTSCVLTFATAYTNAPACSTSDETTAVLTRGTSTTTTLTLSGVFVAGDVVAYNCLGRA